MAQRIVFTAQQTVQLENFEPVALENNQVRVVARYSLMSTGTENIAFNRLFEPGSHWDRYVKYPFYPGYSLVGRVVELGADVKNLQVGAFVAIRAAHASEVVVKAESCYLIPSELNLQTVVWFALAKIAFMGARAAHYSLGDSILIIGAGPIGQMSVRWANAAGAQTIIVTDNLADRLQLAKQGGATHILPLTVEAARETISEITNGNGPRVVIDATGAASVFASALGIVRRQGQVVILGDTGVPTSQHLTSDVITRGISITGAHDTLNDREWNDATISQLFFALVQTNRFNLANLNSHVFSPEQCTEAYKLANERRAETMGIVFDWHTSFIA